MEGRINIVTLAVADLERALAFYHEGLGLETSGITGTAFQGDETQPAGAVVMFKLAHGLILALYPRSELAKDSGISHGPAQSGEFSLGYFTDSTEEVDVLLAQAAAAGGAITDRAHNRPWGIYSGYFRDPDGHLWEIIYSPPEAT